MGRGTRRTCRGSISSFADGADDRSGCAGEGLRMGRGSVTEGCAVGCEGKLEDGVVPGRVGWGLFGRVDIIECCSERTRGLDYSTRGQYIDTRMRYMANGFKGRGCIK